MAGLGNALLPDSEERARLLTSAAAAANRLWDGLGERPIGPAMDGAARRDWLNRFDFQQPVALDLLIPDVAETVANGTLLSQHPRCFGLFNPTPAFPGVVADLIAAAVNPQLAVWSHAPLAVEIEAHVIAALTARLGWAELGGGHFTSGGAEANMTAALMAQLAAAPAFAEMGARAFAGQPTLYASAESHFAWFKIAHQIGIGRAAVRLVPTDGSGRMDVGLLGRMIAEDKAAGMVPTLVVATAGTTNAGMIDPLRESAAAARAHGLWFHVDAAWGGALIASDRERVALDGIELAGTVTIDAHKWFSVPMGAGMLLTRRLETVGETFRVAASYMPAGDDRIDPYTHSAQWSRRFMGLKLFMCLAALGWRGYAEVLERQLALADELGRRLEAAGWKVENRSPVGVLCFNDVAGGDAARIVDILQGRQRSWLSVAKFEGRSVIRACITSFRTDEADLQVLIEELETARGLAGSCPSMSSVPLPECGRDA